MKRHGHRRLHGGDKPSLTYASWANMISRCTSPSSIRWDRYGGRGITVCETWRDFSLFLRDMGERPSRQHSLDRIDNERGYEPDNCRWSTNKEQARNRSTTREVTIHGQNMSLAEAAERSGVSYQTLWNRLKRGLPADRAVAWASAKIEPHKVYVCAHCKAEFCRVPGPRLRTNTKYCSHFCLKWARYLANQPAGKRTCKGCGGLGHNRATCERRQSPPANEVNGP